MAVTTDPNAVYYSYRGVGTNKVVTKFIDLLEEKGIPHRGSESEPINGALTAFEEKIGAANIIVIFYSQEYFESEHCMNEYANIRKYENEARKAATFFVKCGDYDINGLVYFWGGRKAKLETKQYSSLTPIESRSLVNGYYLDKTTSYCIQNLDNYFSDKLHYNKSNLQKLVEIINYQYRNLPIKYDSINYTKRTSKYINDDAPIYITYARSDSKHPGWEHIDDVVDLIKERFVEEKIQYSIDTEDIDAGDTISSFEKAIGEKPYTILVYSDKYFHSWHCMYELAEIRKNKDKKKGFVYINADNIDLTDKYLSDLEDFWDANGTKIAKIRRHNTRKLTDIESEAEKHNYYIDNILDLKSFFSDKNRLYANNLINSKDCLNDLIKTIRKKWFGQKYDSAIVEQKEVKLQAQYYEKAINILVLLPQTPDSLFNLADTYCNLANVQKNHLEDYDSAKENYNKAIEILERLPKDNTEYQYSLALAYNNLANLQTT